MPTLRALFVVALSLLLASMQLGAQLHALEHDNARLARPHGAALLLPGADVACAVCASFAGGAHASPAHGHLLVVAQPSAPRIADTSAIFAGAAPAYYQSRAPPAFL